MVVPVHIMVVVLIIVGVETRMRSTGTKSEREKGRRNRQDRSGRGERRAAQWKGGHILLAAAVLNSTGFYALVNMMSFQTHNLLFSRQRAPKPQQLQQQY